MCWSFCSSRAFQWTLVILGLVVLFLSGAQAMTYSPEPGKEGGPGDTITYRFNVENDDNPPSIWVRLEDNDANFDITFADVEEEIYINDNYDFYVNVKIPDDTTEGRYTANVMILTRQTVAEEYNPTQGVGFELRVVTSTTKSEDSSTGYIVAGIAITGLGIFFLEKKHFLLSAFGLIPAHWRLESDEVLENDVRASVFEQVRNHDGISLSQITTKSGLSKSTVRYALRVLLAFNYIVQGPNRYYYLPGHSTSHLTHTQSTILDKLVTKEAYRQEDLARAVGMTRAGLTHQLDTLIRRGDVERIKRGRQVYYRPSGRGTPVTDESEPPGEHWWEKNSA